MSKVFKRLYTVIGKVTLEHVREQNANGPVWVGGVETASSVAEEQVS